MARKYLTWRRLPRCWAVFSWRSTSLRSAEDMVKRRQHIGIFLHNEMGISLRGISPMCGRSSIHLQKIFFLRSIATLSRAKITEPFGYLVKPVEDRAIQSVVEIALYKHQMERKLLKMERWLATTLSSIGDG